jgi:hypothetical protein
MTMKHILIPLHFALLFTAGAAAQETQFGLKKDTAAGEQQAMDMAVDARVGARAYALRLAAGHDVLVSNSGGGPARLRIVEGGAETRSKDQRARGAGVDLVVAAGASVVIAAKRIEWPEAGEVVVKVTGGLRLGLREPETGLTYSVPVLEGVAEYHVLSPARVGELELAAGNLRQETLVAGPRGGKTASERPAAGAFLTLAYSER